MVTARLDQEQIDTALGTRHRDWTGGPAGLTRSITFADFPTAVEFVVRLAPRCEQLDHHPDLDLRWRRVDVALVTHSAAGVTDKDLVLAGVIDEIAASLPLAD